MIGLAKMVILMLGNDEAGRSATHEIVPRLATRVFTRVVDLPTEGDQPDKLEKETLIKLLSGKTGNHFH